MNQRSSETPSSSSSSPPLPSSSSFMPSSLPGCSSGNESVTVEYQGIDHCVHCKWKIDNFSSKLKTREIWSGNFEVEDFNCSLLLYPNGDSKAQPGYFSIYLQINNESFTRYRLSIVDRYSNSVGKESLNRYSRIRKKICHGWCDFDLISTLVDPESGFISNDDDLVITADILFLKETVSFDRFEQLPWFLDGRFTWKAHNFGLFSKEIMQTHKIIGPVFHARDFNLSVSVYQSNVDGTDYLSICLESQKKKHDPDITDQSCCCLFRISVKNLKPLSHSMNRDACGRLAIGSRSGENSSLELIDYMKMSDFIDPDKGFLVNDTTVFRISFQIIKEAVIFTNNVGSLGQRSMGGGEESDEYIGTFTWRIDNIRRLRHLSRSRDLFDLSVKSKRFKIGDRDCRLTVYPNFTGSQLPYHLSLSLEVTDSRNTASDWSCFVSLQLSVVNQRMKDKSIVKKSQHRYSEAVKDWGCVDFMKMSSLLDQDAGFLVQDSLVFSVEVLILKETSEIQDMELSNAGGQTEVVGAKRSFTWKVKNFSSFKEVMETVKIFSEFFQAGGFELRIGVYEFFDNIYMYLESDQSAGIDPDKNFRVKYKMGVVNQNNSDRTLWKESTMFTNTWTKSVLHFMKVSDMLERDAGFLLDDTIVFVCSILDCRHFSELVEEPKEFKFNPNAESFTPPQTSLRPPSPVFDGSNYFPNNVPAVQHMQGLPMGVGVGTSFVRPQSVMYNPQAAPNQSPQAFIHPSAHLVAPIQSAPALIRPNAHLAAPNQSPQAFIYPNAHLAAPIQSAPALIRPNAHLAAPIQSAQALIRPNAHLAAAIQSPEAFYHPNAHLYGQPMIMDHSHTRVLYMPRYPPGGES